MVPANPGELVRQRAGKELKEKIVLQQPSADRGNMQGDADARLHRCNGSGGGVDFIEFQISQELEGSIKAHKKGSAVAHITANLNFSRYKEEQVLALTLFLVDGLMLGEPYQMEIRLIFLIIAETAGDIILDHQPVQPFFILDNFHVAPHINTMAIGLLWTMIKYYF